MQATPPGPRSPPRGRAGRGSPVAWTYVRGRRSRGDWEGDTGARHRGAVPSLVDRASKFTLLALRRTAGETGEAMRKRLGPYKEFRAHDGQRQGVRGPQGGLPGRASFFFARPYRGLNEHVNGLVRQYKATDFRSPA